MDQPIDLEHSFVLQPQIDFLLCSTILCKRWFFVSVKMSSVPHSLHSHTHHCCHEGPDETTKKTWGQSIEKLAMM